jgi:hypothetical protein
MSDEDFDIVGSYNEDRFKQFACERTVNLYEEMNPDGKKLKALKPTTGYRKIYSTNVPYYGRALFEHKNFVYHVVGNQIFKIDSAFFANIISAETPLNTTSGYVSIDSNEADEIIFADGVAGHIYNEITGAYTKITDANFPSAPSFAVYYDGYFVANNKGTAQFNLSKTNQGLVWSPQVQFSLTSEPDEVIGFANINRRLFVFGKKVTEIWYSNTSPNQTATNPILRDNNILINTGCASPKSIATGFGMLAWLTNNDQGNNSVAISTGGNPTPICDLQFSNFIRDFKKVDDAEAFLYKLDGHVFYQLTFPSENKTIQFDITTQKMHEIQDYGGDRFIASCHAYFGAVKKHIVGSYKDSNLYQISNNYYDYDGLSIRRMRIGKHIFDKAYKRIRIGKVQIDLENGIAAANGEDAEPSMMLGISDDGGISFRCYLRGDVSKLGEFKKRIIFRRLGAFTRDAVFMLDFYHKLPFVVLGGAISYDVKPK